MEGRFAGQAVAGFDALEMVVRTSGYWPEGAVTSEDGAVGVLVGIVLPTGAAGECRESAWPWGGSCAAVWSKWSWMASAGVGGARGAWRC